MSSHFSKSRDPNYVGAAMCPECPIKERQALLATSTGKRPRGRSRSRWSDYISDLAWSRLGVEPAALPEIAVDSEIFRVLRLLPSRPSQRKIRHENE